jgi:hypothetical protein
MIDLSSWPEGSRLILRKERPHPGAQLTFTDIDGHRVTAFLTDTGRGVIPARSRAWSCDTASMPGGGPHPRRQGSRPAQFPPSRLGGE